MNKLVSEPVSPAPLDQESYGIEALQLFSTFTRDSYLTAFGIQAPPWDPQRLSKTWFDSSVSAESDPLRVVTYRVVSPDGAGALVFKDMQMNAAEAATVNLPGLVTYPVYTIAPTGASRGPGTSINPLLLSLENDARALMAELGGTALVDEGSAMVFPVIYPPDEPRRMWGIVYNGGHEKNVGALLQLKNAHGLGAPGHWNMASGDPIWVPELVQTGFDDPRSPRPIPVRDLLPNEELRSVMTGFGVVSIQVVRTDLERQAKLRSGAFLETDRQMLADILRAVTKPV